MAKTKENTADEKISEQINEAVVDDAVVAVAPAVSEVPEIVEAPEAPEADAPRVNTIYVPNEVHAPDFPFDEYGVCRTLRREIETLARRVGNCPEKHKVALDHLRVAAAWLHERHAAHTEIAAANAATYEKALAAAAEAAVHNGHGETVEAAAARQAAAGVGAPKAL